MRKRWVLLLYLFYSTHAAYKLIFIQICFVLWSHPVVTQSMLQICITVLQYLFHLFFFVNSIILAGYIGTHVAKTTQCFKTYLIFFFLIRILIFSFSNLVVRGLQLRNTVLISTVFVDILAIKKSLNKNIWFIKVHVVVPKGSVAQHIYSYASNFE